MSKKSQKGDVFTIAFSFFKKNKKVMRKCFSFVLGLISLFLTFSMFFTPLYVNDFTGNALVPIDVVDFGSGMLLTLVAFLPVCVFSAVALGVFLSSIRSYFKKDTSYVTKTQRCITVSAVFTGLYYLAGMVICTILNNKSGSYSSEDSSVLFIWSVVIAILYAFVVGSVAEEKRSVKSIKTAKGARIEMLIYTLLGAVFTLVACLTDILKVKFIEPASYDAVTLNGYKLLTTYEEAQSGFQVLAFVLMVVVMIVSAFAVFTLISFISKSKLFFKFAQASLFFSGLATLLIGLFGKYYEIVQRINENLIVSWLSQSADLSGLKIVYKISSPSVIWFGIVVALIAFTVFRKPYTKGTLSEALISVNGPVSSDSAGSHAPVSSGMPSFGAAAIGDPCPAFSELDSKEEQLQEATKKAEEHAVEEPGLPGLVQFVVNYARDSRLHLSYSVTDIATFIAGLGASRLTILQGMSGTGKTSLPKIFTEAILGNCEIIEVESSWRDKHELLGYYNEFSRIYTPKKFTQALYKSVLDPQRVTFIVLDELNLSRIEYYFSDFLSLMEHEEDRRQIKLLNTGLYCSQNGQLYEYKGLKDGHTIQIPDNIWFIGTANRDESTFEISDKVYDRAHTMNFNKRAPKPHSVLPPMEQRYYSKETLLKLFEQAKQNVVFDIDDCTVIKEVEELLVPYNITFGNRISNQIEDFVKIYASCFVPSEAIIHEAVEIILLSKVVSKLEFKSVDNREELAEAFDRLNLHKCSQFVLSLNED
ncbi:MAG: AAA family ATPase [Clostridia bacterium]|nr:AAA family ATPase [Clostridia bacterium]